MVSLATLRIVATTLNGFAQFSTCFRLEFRRRNKILWFDDGFAAFATICSFIALVCFWLTTETEGAGPMVESQVSRFRAYWILSTTTILVVWLSRVGIIFSCIRIAPLETSLTIPGYILSGLIAAMGTSLFALRIYFCSHNSDWKLLAQPTCPDNQIQKPLNTAFELLSDLLMVAAPFAIILRVKDSPECRHLLYGLLFAGIVLMASSVMHVVFFIRSDHDLEILTASIQVALFLAMTNIPTLLGYIISRHQGSDRLSGSKKQRDVEQLRGRIGAPTILRSESIVVSSAPLPKDKCSFTRQSTPSTSKSFTGDELPALNVDLASKVGDRNSVTIDSASEYSTMTPVYPPSPEPAAKQGKRARFLMPSSAPIGRDIVSASSYASIFAQYMPDDRPESGTSNSSFSRPSEPMESIPLGHPLRPAATEKPIPF